MTHLAARAIVAAATLAATKGPLVFGHAGDWYVVSRAGALLSSFRQAGGLSVKDAAVSPTSEVVVFTSWSDEVRNPLLYRAKLSGGPAELLSEPRGFHAAPVFSNDGKWVYFAHHPLKGGPPGQHEAGATAQLYRIRIDGKDLQPMTKEAGCHMTPSLGSGSVVVVAHTQCTVGRSIKTLSGSKTVNPLEPLFGDYGWPALHPLEKKVAFVEQTRVGAIVLERGIGDPQPAKVLFQFEGNDDNYRLAYDEDGTGLLYQTRAGVFHHTGSGQTVSVVVFEGGTK